MPNIVYHFRAPHGHQWTMEPACGTEMEPSINPAPIWGPCIYIIHNSDSNQTYVGYAGNAYHRWETRTEAFHCMGIERDLGKQILCACCIPVLGDGEDWTKYIPYPALAGPGAAEHLLIRAVANGLLAKGAISTNTMLRDMPCPRPLAPPPLGVVKMQIYLPTHPWGNLRGERQVTLPPVY
jgi:hypothetical protein